MTCEELRYYEIIRRLEAQKTLAQDDGVRFLTEHKTLPDEAPRKAVCWAQYREEIGSEGAFLRAIQIVQEVFDYD